MNNNLENCIYIHGLGISFYRSFPKEIQRIYPFKKINLFIGRNNSGKSNILNFLYKHYLSVFRGEDADFKDVDYHNFALFQKNEIKIEFYFYNVVLVFIEITAYLSTAETNTKNPEIFLFIRKERD